MHSVPSGSAESLRLSYKTGLKHLVKGYAAYLHRNILETGAPEPSKPKPGPAIGVLNSVVRNVTGSTGHLLNGSLVRPADKVNGSITCKADGSSEDFGLIELKGSNNTTEGDANRNTSAGHIREEDDSERGLLVIEPRRKVSHSVQHHPCESAAIQQALVTLIMKAQDLEHNINFFLFPQKVLQSLVRQRDDFELKTS